MSGNMHLQFGKILKNLHSNIKKTSPKNEWYIEKNTGNVRYNGELFFPFESITKKVLETQYSNDLSESKVENKTIFINLDFNLKKNKKSDKKIKKRKDSTSKISTQHDEIQKNTSYIFNELSDQSSNFFKEESNPFEISKPRLEDKKMIDFMIAQSTNNFSGRGFFLRSQKSIRKIKKYWDKTNLIYPFTFRKLKTRVMSKISTNQFEINDNCNNKKMNEKKNNNQLNDFFIITEDYSQKIINPENVKRTWDSYRCREEKLKLLTIQNNL